MSNIEARAFPLPTNKAVLSGEVLARESRPIERDPQPQAEAPADSTQTQPMSIEKRVDAENQPVPSTRKEIGHLIESPDAPQSLKLAATMSLESFSLKDGFTSNTATYENTTVGLRAKGNQLIQSSREARDFSYSILQDARQEYEQLEWRLGKFGESIESYERISSSMVKDMDSDAHAYEEKAGHEGEWGKDYMKQARPAAEAALSESSAYVRGAFEDLFRHQVAKKLLDADLAATTKEFDDIANRKLFGEQQLAVAQNKLVRYQETIDEFMPDAEMAAENENQAFQGTGLNASLMDPDSKHLRAMQIVLERIGNGEYDVSEFDDEPSTLSDENDTRTTGQVFVDDYTKLTKSIADTESRLSQIGPVFDELTKKRARLEQELRDTNLEITGIEQAEEIPQGFLTLAQTRAKLEASKRLAAKTEALGQAQLNALTAIENHHGNMLNELQNLPKPVYESPVPTDELTARRLGEILAARGTRMPNLGSAESLLGAVADIVADAMALRSGNPEGDPKIDHLLGSYLLNRVGVAGIAVDRAPEQAISDMVMVYQGLAERDRNAAAAEKAAEEAAAQAEPAGEPTGKTSWMKKFGM